MPPDLSGGTLFSIAARVSCAGRREHLGRIATSENLSYGENLPTLSLLPDKRFITKLFNLELLLTSGVLAFVRVLGLNRELFLVSRLRIRVSKL